MNISLTKNRSYFSIEKNLDFVYEQEAEVGIIYPQNISDWLKQKVRNLGGSYQINEKIFILTNILAN